MNHLSRIASIVGILGLSSSCVVNAQAPPASPPSPPSTYEIWNQTNRSHSIEAQCAGSIAEVAWDYKDGDVRISRFSFNAKALPEKEFVRLNELVDEIGGDIHVWLECNSEIALVLFRQAQTHGNAEAKRIQLHTDGAKILQIRKFGF